MGGRRPAPGHRGDAELVGGGVRRSDRPPGGSAHRRWPAGAGPAVEQVRHGTAGGRGSDGRAQRGRCRRAPGDGAAADGHRGRVVRDRAGDRGFQRRRAHTDRGGRGAHGDAVLRRAHRPRHPARPGGRDELPRDRRSHRRPDHLARYLAAAGRPGPVLNAGISGNRLRTDSTVLGDSGLTRFRRDVLDQPGVGTVVVLIGINDIGLAGSMGPDGQVSPRVSAEQLVAGYRELVAAARAAGVRVVGATLLPFAGSPYYSADGDRLRSEVNSWIRSPGAFDAVADLDRAMAAPTGPARLAEALDSGDHLHPNDSGYAMTAATIGAAILA
ncbi:GDSL-type esterase/lipase family protein [Nocardia sp. MW-W600-9]